MYVDFYLLDSRVSATALEQSPYHANQVGQPAKYVEPSGIYLQLFGRSDDGQSVVVEAALYGLTLSFLDEHDSAMSDDLYAQAVEDEVVQRACAHQPELADPAYTDKSFRTGCRRGGVFSEPSFFLRTCPAARPIRRGSRAHTHVRPSPGDCAAGWVQASRKI